jgi:rfaE bifunctional protein nucleotidyltransferase chain/domain
MSQLQALHNKIFDKKEAIKQVQNWRNDGLKVVFTNGCFDILHKGHVSYLAKTSDFGDKLIVALNTDRSVKAQGKGEDRPINPEDARLLVLAALQFVDAVVLFDSDTPIDEIKLLKPSVLVKGADYNPEEVDEQSKKYIVGSKEVREYGGEVKVVDLLEGFSTTKILAKGKV